MPDQLSGSAAKGTDVSYTHDPEHLDEIRQEVRDQLAADRAAAEAKDKAEGGLERRYHVERLNDTEGKHADCQFFVLDPLHDPIAREALYCRLLIWGAVNAS